uniref:RING-type domain-containing protein n=1 Tax=Oncorhynchus kisutch TaxID=8019 RepID=A0A8C7F069_ONCKI
MNLGTFIHLQCFICLDVFTEPVTISCGHNFCKACISRPLELFCRTDQTCVCQFCTETDHKAHNTVKLGKTEADVQQMIQERLQKVQEIKHSVELSKKHTRREISDSVQVFTDLVRSIERSQGELIEVIEEKQKATERRAEWLIKELEQEITELKGRSTDLEQLLHTEDPLHLLQSFPTLCTPPHTQDWSEVFTVICVWGP